MREEDLWDMSDDELAAAFKEAQAQEQSPDTDLEAEEAPTEEFDESETSMEDTDEEVDLDNEESTDEEIDDGPEQSEDEESDDSGHDTSEESDTEEVDDEDESDDEEEAPDEDSEAEEDPGSEDTDEEKEDKQPAQTYKFKANGKDYEFSSDEIVDQFPRIFGQAMDYTKKMQTIKPWRKTIDAIEGAQLSHNDVSLMIDVLKGDRDAVTEVLKRTGIDTLELDTEADSTYVAKDYGRDDSALAINDIVEDISRDAEYATTHSILTKEWDEASWETMAQTPEMIRLLHTDVKSGMFNTLQPIAEKLKVYDNGRKSDIEYYKDAAQQHFTKTAEQNAYNQQQAERRLEQEAAQKERERVAQAKAQSTKRTAVKQASAKRKAAAPTKSVASNRDVTDYLDDSDEAFEEWYQKLQDSM